MLADLQTMTWKEWREYLPRAGAQRGNLLGLLLFPLIFGVLIPSRQGTGWLSSAAVLYIAAIVPNAAVAGVVADSFVGERERHTLATLLASRLPDRAILFGKLIAAVVYGWAIALATLLVGAVVANLKGTSGLHFYRGDIFAGAVLLTFLMAVFSASAGVLISLRTATVRQAQQLVSLTIIVPAVVPTFALTVLSDSQRRDLLRTLAQGNLFTIVLIIAAALAVVDAALLLTAAGRFRRSRLALDGE